MCFGGGGSSSYDAYKGGTAQQWESLYKYANDLQDQISSGTLSAEQRAKAEADLAKAQDALKKTEDVASQDPAFATQMREDKRQRDVKVGQRSIDDAFSKFDDGYYGQYKTDYTDFYQPQLEDQFAKARSKMIAALAGRGMLESTVGAGALADTQKQYDTTKTNIANQAQDAANTLRSSVENSKSNLYSLNEASADPQGIAARAVGESTALVAPPQYSQLEDTFANVLAPFLSLAVSAKTSPGSGYSSPIKLAGGKGSGSVVR